MPTLIQKFEDMVTLNKLKRSYSEIVNALEMRKQELGSHDYKDMFDLSVYTAEEAMDGIVKYLNIVERCNAYTHGCGDGYKIKPNIKVNNGQGQTSFTNTYYSERAVLSDGTIVSFAAQQWSGECVFKYEYLVTDENGNYVLDENNNPIKSESTTVRCANIMFDIDGHKGKNQFGYDAYRIKVLPTVLEQEGGQGGNLFDTMRTGKFNYEKYNLGAF